MARQTFQVVTHKPTGRRLILDIKQSWNRLYYSFDGGFTWALKKSEAYTAAEERGQLNFSTSVPNSTKG